MNPEFLPATTAGRAIRAYLILLGCATRRQTITFSALASSIELAPLGVGPTLNMLHQWCVDRNLPSLSVLAVDLQHFRSRGPFADQPLEVQLTERARVYKYTHWTDLVPPAVEDL